MTQYFLRRRTWVFLAIMLLVGLVVPAFSLLHNGREIGAHAQGTPTVTMSSTIVHYGDLVTATAQGFAAGETVQLQIEDQYTNTWGAGTLTCDSNGTCVGPVSLGNGCAGGPYTLIATGQTSQLKATTPFTINPKVTLNNGHNPSGGPGDLIYVEGDGFARAESNVFIYWGTRHGIKEGLGSVDACGSLFFQFNAPTNVTPGDYKVTIARQNMNPPLLGAIFRILPPALTVTPGSLTPGQALQVQLQGFDYGEQVAVSWNANGGQQLATTANSSISVTLPAAPHGTYTLTARGTTSGLQATASLMVVPGITVTPLPINPGGTITVAGGGFAANESIAVYFQTTSNGTSTVTADASGSFTTTLVLPSKYNAYVPSSVYAKSTSGTDQASARVVFTTPALNFTFPTYSYGQQTSLVGQGFAANETVKLFWNYKQTGQLLVTTATAHTDGTVGFTVTMPSDPDLGTVFVAAVGETSGITAIASLGEQAAVIITPTSGPAGTTIQVNGGGFGSFDQVNVYFNNTVLATRAADVRGAFTATIKVPPGTPTGLYEVAASGQYSHVGVNTSFTVPPTVSINPTSGPSGTRITITGSKFTPSGGVDIDWYDPQFGLSYLTSVTASPTGTFTVTVTAPSNLISGNVYFIEARDSSGAFGKAQFTAQ